jgi:hypothetical protein
MDDAQISELLSCALHLTMSLRVGRSRHRAQLALVRAGLLVPAAELENPSFNPALVAALPDNTILVLTDKGKAYIRALNPDDFADREWWPRRQDVIDAQKRLAET